MPILPSPAADSQPVTAPAQLDSTDVALVADPGGAVETIVDQPHEEHTDEPRTTQALTAPQTALDVMNLLQQVGLPQRIRIE